MENKKPLISIIILNYNAGDLILNCLDSVVQTKYENYEIILVDNVSTDNSHKKCKEKYTRNVLKRPKTVFSLSKSPPQAKKNRGFWGSKVAEPLYPPCYREI